ncbi:hypothetical protein [Mycobacterium sp. TY814]|uniref:hypothetical protein n=1 Tax=Mycobacterium sp. TY814 TaxID=3050580 RepID=UPI0027412482|nr:hypothetical protein [Mycobacterium sp. TY814]MDP7721817.1 hypothetical protein [Mycobacterium sp. TY814]
MSDVRARLAEALRNHFKLHRAGRPEEWVCGGCHADFHNFQCHEDHVADVLLSLEGVAIVALPEPDDTGSGQGGEFDAWWGRYPDNDPHHAPRWAGYDVWAEHGKVHTSAIHEHTPDQARALAAVLLAAADAAKAAGGEHDPECEHRGRYDRFEGVEYCAGCGAAQS